MAHPSSPSARPSGGAAALAAAAILVAFILAVIDAVSPILDALPAPLAFLIFGLLGLAFGSREMAVRAQFSAQADLYNASRSELEAKNRWFNITEAHTRVGHWRLDLTTNMVFWSNATYAIHGLEPGTPPSLDDALNSYHKDDRDIVVKNIQQSRETGQSYAFRARIIGADGKLRYVDAGASIECAADGTPKAIFGVIKDRTSEEDMQETLRRARDSARTLTDSKGQFFARMSHEIRTPMNGLIGFVELLKRSELTTEQRRYTDLIIDSGKSLQTLLNDILDLTKIEAGQTAINIKTVEIRHLLSRVTQMSEPAAREKGLNLIYEVAPNVPHQIEIDGLRLRQIVSNLLSNALRFTDKGTVSLTARIIANDMGKHELLFAVSDTGNGIASKSQEHTDPADFACGTDLGLAISRQLAELMGGGLTLRSELGKGSVFTLRVPLVDSRVSADLVAGASTQISADQEVPPLLNNPARILLTEDYDINRELITDMTQRMGVTIECAEDGAEAIAMIHKARAVGRPYGLVFMDIQMPNLSGLEATERLRASGVSEDELPIVALTANAFDGDIEDCLAAGMQAHLSKPVSMQRLADAINKWAPANRSNEY